MGKNTLKASMALGLGVIAAAQSGPAMAANLTAPFDIENTAVLPKGVRNPRFKNIMIPLETKFNDNGVVEPLGQPLNKRVTWNDIVEAQTTTEDKNLVAGSVSSMGMSGTDSPGSTTGQVNTAVDVKVPVLAMGVTDRLTLAVAVPVYHVDISTATGFVKSDQGQAFVNDVCSSDPTKCNDAKRKLDDAINQKLTRLGYQPVQSRTVSNVGDIKFVGKYRLQFSDKHSIAFKPTITAPTGVAPNADQAVDVPTGDGQWDVGATVVEAYQLLPWLEVSANATYTNQLPDRIERRIPKSADDRLSSDRETLNRNLGDQYSVGWTLTFGDPHKGLSLATAYSFQYMDRVTYQGSMFSKDRYSFLEQFDQPEQWVHSATVMATFATIDWFKEGKFFYPFQAQVAYSRPFAGRNVAAADVLAAEIVLFF
ncbi:MAG TPA: hypothetical protein VL588_01645 [Bdellovibrionota bacterium]|nr:hypothetical protein [Bdellovibrionota bacterium]